MIPAQNTSHAIVSVPFERIHDLIEAVRDAGILPRQIPPGGAWEMLELPMPRIDLGFRVRYRAELGPIEIEAWRPDGTDEIRLGAAINLIQAELEAYELSTGDHLTSIDFAVSGRVYVSGSIEPRPHDKAVFFVLRRVRATPDDTSAGLPTPWPEVDLGQIMTRIADRALRAQLAVAGNLPERALPLNPALETGKLLGVQLNLAAAYTAPAQRDDWLSHPVCLPPGFGDPGCAPGPGTDETFYDRIEVYAAAATTPAPVPVNQVGRQFQIDIGVDLLRQALAEARTPEWRGDGKYLLFRYEYELDAAIRDWPHSVDDIGFWFGFTGREFVWYPKTKWCEGWTWTPWGDVKYTYPCGVEDGWAETQSFHVETMFRLYTSGEMICVERREIVVEHDQNLLGRLWEFILTGLVFAIPVVGPILGTAIVLGEMIVFMALVLARLILKIVDAVAPNQACVPLNGVFARVPVVEDRVDALVSRPVLEMKTNGITVAFDADFEKR